MFIFGRKPGTGTNRDGVHDVEDGPMRLADTISIQVRPAPAQDSWFAPCISSVRSPNVHEVGMDR